MGLREQSMDFNVSKDVTSAWGSATYRHSRDFRVHDVYFKRDLIHRPS